MLDEWVCHLRSPFHTTCRAPHKSCVLRRACFHAGAPSCFAAASGQGASSVSLLAVQDIMGTVKLQQAAAAAEIPVTAPASGTSGKDCAQGQGASIGTTSKAGNPEVEAAAWQGGSGSRKERLPGSHASISPGAKQEPSRKKLIEAGLELEGLRAVFNEEAVFAACQIAADAASMAQALALQPAPAAEQQPTGAAERPSEGAQTSPRKHSQPDAQQARTAVREGGQQKKTAAKNGKYVLELSARLSDLQAEVQLSEAVCWGVHVQTVSASYGARCLVVERVMLSLNTARLISLGAAVATFHLPSVLEAPDPESSPWLTIPAAENAEDLGRALTGAILPPSARMEPEPERLHDFDESLLESASLMNSMVTDLDGEDDSRTLSRFVHHQCHCIRSASKQPLKHFPMPPVHRAVSSFLLHGNN